MKKKGLQFRRIDTPVKLSADHLGTPQDDSWGGRALVSDYVVGTPHKSDPTSFDEYGSFDVHHHAASGYTQYPPKNMTEEGPADASVQDWQPPFSGPRQQSLFNHQSSPGSSKIITMGGTRSAAPAMMVGLGIAANDTAKRYGREMDFSNNLSPHSRNLVQKLSDKGAVDAPTNLSNNDSDFTSGPEDIYLGKDSHSYSEAEVNAGRRTLRSVLGKRQKSQGEQGTLFSDD